MGGRWRRGEKVALAVSNVLCCWARERTTTSGRFMSASGRWPSASLRQAPRSSTVWSHSSSGLYRLAYWLAEADEAFRLQARAYAFRCSRLGRDSRNHPASDTRARIPRRRGRGKMGRALLGLPGRCSKPCSAGSHRRPSDLSGRGSCSLCSCHRRLANHPAVMGDKPSGTSRPARPAAAGLAHTSWWLSIYFGAEPIGGGDTALGGSQPQSSATDSWLTTAAVVCAPSGHSRAGWPGFQTERTRIPAALEGLQGR